MMKNMKSAIICSLMALLPPHEIGFSHSLLGSSAGAAWHKSFNGRQPSVKRANRQAKVVRAQRRARRLGHA